MKKFWKDNKYIVIFLEIALVYAICYFVISDKETILSMLYAVALSYIAAFIFYLFQVHFPEKRKRKVVNKIIYSRINAVVIKVEELYKEMFKLYNPNFDNNMYASQDMNNLLKFRFDDATSIADIRRIDNLTHIQKSVYKTLRELTGETIRVFIDKVDFLYKTFPNYLSEDLIDILEKMRNSLFMQIIPFQLQSPLDSDFTKLGSNMFEEFWKLNNELKKCNGEIN